MTATPNKVPRLRSALFIPAHRRDFLAKAASTGADGLILDLEDAVPPPMRGEARTIMSDWIANSRTDQAVCVRVNGLAAGCLDEDLAAAVAPGLTAVLISKVQNADDVAVVDQALSRHEQRRGLPPMSVRIWPLLETAYAVHKAYDICSSTKRIAYMGVGGSANGDLARDMGFQFSRTFYETLYIRSKVLLDVRAAGVPNPMAGIISAVRDTELVESHARFMRGLGYEGLVTIHPTQVQIANAIFGPSPGDIATAKELIEKMEKAEKEGQGSIMHQGGMVDAAHVLTARALLADAELFEKRRVNAAVRK